MKNDLISREALKENGTVIGIVNGQKMKVIPLSFIDNAPTVEYTFEEAFQKTVCEQRLYCPERPQGEWIDTGDMQEYWAEEYQCSICGAKDHRHNYCPNCGAKLIGSEKMNGGAE